MVFLHFIILYYTVFLFLEIKTILLFQELQHGVLNNMEVVHTKNMYSRVRRRPGYALIAQTCFV